MRADPTVARLSRKLRRIGARIPGSRTYQELQRLRRQGRTVHTELNALREEVGRLTSERLRASWAPPGHASSPIPSLDAIRSRADRIFDRSTRALPGIDLDDAGQLGLLEELKGRYGELPFAHELQAGLRYHYGNDFFSYSDAIFLSLLVRHLAPKRVVSVGAGYSSCALLDINDRFFEGAISCTFVHPDPNELGALLRRSDFDAHRFITSEVQDVGLEPFAELDAGDILLVDSSHVSKTGSDVNHLFFEVLPRLRSGVWAQIHGVFYPFEYPEAWVEQGRAWNEDYLVRAFLMFNDAFAIRLFSSYVVALHEEWFRREMPLCLENPGGSLWLQRR
ncbi:MAG TPA: class I SAM-dependent methyltransferase [Actinomycetota bacterium]|nr:class I SAM-dependent methyltransferase [Actinomycetota bacterium]